MGFDHFNDIKECRALHTFNTSEVKSLFVRLKRVEACWILTPLLNKNKPPNLKELKTCLNFINLLCSADVPFATSISPWHLLLAIFRIFNRTIVVFGEESYSFELNLIMYHISQQIVQKDLPPDEKVVQAYENIFT